MQRRGTVYRGHSMLCPDLLGHHLLEPVHIRTHRRNPCGIKTFLHIAPLIAANFWRDKGNEAAGPGRYWSELFSYFHKKRWTDNQKRRTWIPRYSEDWS